MDEDVPSQAVPETKQTPRLKSCFVVSPIGREGSEDRKRSDEVLKFLIAAAVQPIGYGKLVRADSLAQPARFEDNILDGAR
jgi:hypothetical protein